MNTDNKDLETKKESEIKEARAELKDKGFYNFFIKPMFEYWKEHPFKSIGTFIFWFGLYYVIFSGIQAGSFSMTFCDSETHSGYDGRVFEVLPQWNEFIYDRNIQCQRPIITGIMTPEGIKEVEPQRIDYDCDEPPILKCDVDWNEFTSHGWKTNTVYFFQTWGGVILKE